MQQQQSLWVSDMSLKIGISAAVTLILRGSYRISQLLTLLDLHQFATTLLTFWASREPATGPLAALLHLCIK